MPPQSETVREAVSKRAEIAAGSCRAGRIAMLGGRGWIVPALLLVAPVPALANVITDWDEKAVALLQPGTVFPPPTAVRTTALLHLAMFEAVNSIERSYKPYSRQIAVGPDT